MFWAIITVTTVELGDTTPTTSMGKIFESILMIVGYEIIAVPTGIVSPELIKPLKTEIGM